MDQTGNSLSSSARWLLFLLPAVLFLMNLGGAPLFDVDEGAFSEATREMFVRHDFLSTWLNGAPRFDKPILIYWCQAVFVWLFGPNEWSFRLPSALAASGWCYAVGLFAWQRFGRTAGILACGIAATSLGVHVIGRAATADALLNMLLALALLDGWRHLESGQRTPLLRSYVWIGLGVLTKGPIALLVPGATTLIYCLTAHRFKDWLRSVFNPLGWVILLAITVPWYAAALAIHGQDFINGFILKHNVQRFSGSLEGHSGSMFYYVLMIPALLLPWLSWLIAAVRQLPADWKLPERRFLWLWFLFVTVFFSLSGTKLPHYALYGCTPLFALLAIHRERVTNVWLAAAPLLVLLAFFLALPALAAYATPAGWVKNAYYLAQLERVQAAIPHGYYVFTALVLTAALVLLLRAGKLQMPAWCASLGIACATTVLLAVSVAPFVGDLLQGPVKRAGLAARQYAEPTVLWNFHAPSFSVYRQQVSPTVQAQPGQIALTRVDRLPADANVDVLYKEGGVVLVKVK
ncbi:glycosyltransferase family 39 protein [Uliginosibacterium sp. 31-16]|uniref:ArnT family glycosyltransferase n=1 Tax=Uliginosibacterium sp. 31-16 TaxID=3068315 RepID=UPI00274002D5|nr:glycosyltransferase family 39 protein [Uliginosibacterium sp. 31-16]MDP5239891.1 glycosyltransferase family 39 protein [Uliginosibacterium sp. 31-16]